MIEACKINGTKLVFFDNTYMYPQNDHVLTEETAFAPVGRKGNVRRKMAEMVLSEIESSELEAVICRAPEFYGPDKTQSITNTLIFNNIKEEKKLRVPLSAVKKRSLIWTPDASRATALIGNTPDAFGQTWLSANYLSDMLRVQTGQTTQQHFQNRLVEKAKELLSTTEMSVPEIAYPLGFEHPQSFHHLFKSRISVSPIEFRVSFK